ncbi:MAG: ArsJ-associated glyceraldehyde-3-phosphate dehydrogenase [Rhodospirillaceae bacterium]
MSIRVGINGFGRMGRLVMRAGWDNPAFSFVHVNEKDGGPDVAAHLLEFDSVHGRWRRDIKAGAGAFSVDGAEISYSNNDTPGKTDWAAAGCDIVLECTGKFKTTETLQPYFDGGVKTVIVAAPVKDGALNIVMGCNDGLYDPEKHRLLTNASCTTNCLAPLVKVMHEGIGIKHGVITTIHDVTNTQVIVDKPHKDLRRARSALNSLVPTSTGSAKAIGVIYPELVGKLTGLAVRVPLLNASITDCVFEMTRKTTAEEVNGLFRAAAGAGLLKDILGYEERPLVSADFLNDPRSSIVDAMSTTVVNGTQVKIIAWYDNEWGYVNRMAELTARVAASL